MKNQDKFFEEAKKMEDRIVAGITLENYKEKIFCDRSKLGEGNLCIDGIQIKFSTDLLFRVIDKLLKEK